MGSPATAAATRRRKAAVEPPARPATTDEPSAGDDVREAQLKALALAFKRAFRSVGRLRGRDTHLEEGQLSHAQYELLSELRERGALPAGELAAAARLTPATVTQMLEHLAAEGHVERVRSDSDRRVVVSRLTPQGTRQIEAKHAAWRSRWEQATAGLSPQQLRGATVVLERVAAMFEEASPGGICEQLDGRANAPAQAGGKPT
jgi:MarR family transcriptional regulator, organic hydroperoxide resistance regulator